MAASHLAGLWSGRAVHALARLPRRCGRLGAAPTLAPPGAGGHHQRGLCCGHLPVAGLPRAAPPGIPRAGRVRRRPGAAGRDRRAAAAGADLVRLPQRAHGCFDLCIRTPASLGLSTRGLLECCALQVSAGRRGLGKRWGAALQACGLVRPQVRWWCVGCRPGSDRCAAPGAGTCATARPP